MTDAIQIRLFSLIFGLALALPCVAPKPAAAQSEPFLGQLMLLGGLYCPENWVDANGAMLPIAKHTALFALFGTIYGGDGRNTFGLPDLRGRSPIGEGKGPGLSDYRQGNMGGFENLTVRIENMPAHNHQVQVTNEIADKNGPGSDFLAKTAADQDIYHDGPPSKIMDPAMITYTGGSQPINKRSPYLTMRWCVALTGVYPSRP